MGKEGLPHIESPIHIKGEEGRKPTTGKTAGMASLAACSTGSGVSRWSAQSCGPRRQSWRRRALASPGQVGSVLLCRRGRRHGKPGGLLHGQRRLQVERAVLRATPPVLAADGVGKPRTGWVCVALPARPPAWQAWRLAPLGADTPVRPYRRHDWVEKRAAGKGSQGRQECRPQAWRPAHKKSLPHENRPQTRASAPQRRPARHHSVCPRTAQTVFGERGNSQPCDSS